MQALSARLDRFVETWLGIPIDWNEADFEAADRLELDKRTELIANVPTDWRDRFIHQGDRFIVVAEIRQEGDPPQDQPTVSVEAKRSARGFCAIETHDQYHTQGGFRTIRDVETIECPDADFFWTAVVGVEAKLAAFAGDVRSGMRGYIGYDNTIPEFESGDPIPYRRNLAKIRVFTGGNGVVELLPSLDPRNVCCMFFGILDFVGFPSWSAVKRHLGLLTMNLNTARKAQRLQADCATKGWTCVVGAQHRDCTITCGDERVTVVLYDDEWLMHKYALVNQAGLNGQYISLHRNSRAELTNLLDGLLSVPPPLEDAPD